MTYDINNNPLEFEKSFKERLKEFKSVDPWSKKGIQEREEFYKQYGRGWYWFAGVQNVPRYADQWVEQFRVKDTDGNE